MSVLVCGSIAYDSIMVFHDRFKNHILPEQIHILNVAFLVPDLRREFGGCAGNIAYNLRLLGDAPRIMATVGDDAGPYRERLTALDDNQITAFHPGAMTHSHLNRVADAEGIRLGIVAPDGREGMLVHARQFVDAGIPFVFDPGQGLPLFSGEELLEFLELASYCAVNDYEAKLLCEKTGLGLEELAGRVDALVVTLGGQGSQVYVGGRRIDNPCARAASLEDPTSCSDAYRAGMIHGLLRGWGWPNTGRLRSRLGAAKVASRGGQNHAPGRDEIAARYHAEFGAERKFCHLSTVPTP